MKSADFFIKKAQEYLTSIDEITPNYISLAQAMNEQQYEAQYKAQSAKFDDTILKIKLLFSEFDNGKLFTDRIDDVHDVALLESYKHVLNLFIEHLNEFRKASE